MSFIDQISVLVLTYNEAPNIGRTLDALTAFPEVVVLDSGSTDGTVQIACGHPNVRIETRPFDNHSAQWNHGLAHCGLSRPWVLALDADYVLPDAVAEELSRLAPTEHFSGYRARFRYCIGGRALRGALYTPVVVLYRRDKARYVQTGHTQRVVVDGDIGELAARIHHDDRKPLKRWLSSQKRYAVLEASHLNSTPRDQLRTTDKIRLTGWAPPLVFLYTLIWKRCILDGRPGWYYVLQRTLAETMIALELLESRLSSSRSRRAPPASTPPPVGAKQRE